MSENNLFFTEFSTEKIQNQLQHCSGLQFLE